MSTDAPKLTVLAPLRVRYYEVVNLYQHTVVAATAAVGPNWELVFAPRTLDKSARASIEALAADDPRVRFEPAEGGASFIEAWEHALLSARGDYVLSLGTSDAPINRLPEIMQFATGGIDLVNCKRGAPDHGGIGAFIRYLGSEIVRAFKGDAADMRNARLLSREAAAAVVELPRGERFEGARIADDRLSQAEFVYPAAPPPPARFLAMEEVLDAAMRPEPKPALPAPAPQADGEDAAACEAQASPAAEDTTALEPAPDAEAERIAA